MITKLVLWLAKYEKKKARACVNYSSFRKKLTMERYRLNVSNEIKPPS
jgi:hypothetical protein